MNITANTIVFKGTMGDTKGWQARTRVNIKLELDKNHELEISTYKGSRGIESHASVFLVEGSSRIHSFAFGGDGDFRKTMLITKERCTEKTIRSQHDQAIAQLDVIIPEIVAHYANQKQQAA